MTSYKEKLAAFKRNAFLKEVGDENFDYPNLEKRCFKEADLEIKQIKTNFSNPIWIFENFNCDDSLPAPKETDKTVKIVDSKGYTIFIKIDEETLTIFNPNSHFLGEQYERVGYGAEVVIPCSNKKWGLSRDYNSEEYDENGQLIEVPETQEVMVARYFICGYLGAVQTERFDTRIESAGWHWIQ